MGNCLGCTSSSSHDGTPVCEVKQSRGCTDLPMLLLFAASWFAIWTIFGTAISQGADINRLIRGVDYNDNICGKTQGFEDTPLAMWPTPPGMELVTSDPASPSDLYAFKICVDSCNKTLDSAYASTPHNSSKFLFYCVPSVLTANFSGSTFDDEFNTGAQKASRAFGDLSSAWKTIFFSGIIAIVLSFVYAWVCKHFAGSIVFGGIFLIAAGGFFISWTLLTRADEIEVNGELDGERIQTLRIMAYVAGAMTVVFLLIIFFLRKRIKIAVQVVKESSQAVSDVPSLIVFPVFPLTLALLYFIFWIYVALFITSVSNVVVIDTPQSILASSITAVAIPETFKDRSFDENMQRSAIFHFFHLLWNFQFLIYLGYMVVAGVIADWYFTPYQDGEKVRGPGDNQLNHGVVRRSMRRTIFYHLGTIAFGALIIAIIQFIRFVVSYLQRKSKNQNNRVQQAVFCLVQCCLKCVQCCMDNVSKNAFIFCSVYGDAFCPSAVASFKLVWRNLARVAAVSTVGSFIIFLGKIIVSLLTTGIACLLLVKTSLGEDLSSPIVPGVAVLCLAYIVSSIFMIIYETAIDSIFLCFLIDEENNKGGVMLASESLQNIINQNAEASKKMADELGAGQSGTAI